MFELFRLCYKLLVFKHRHIVLYQDYSLLPIFSKGLLWLISRTVFSNILYDYSLVIIIVRIWDTCTIVLGFILTKVLLFSSRVIILMLLIVSGIQRCLFLDYSTPFSDKVWIILCMKHFFINFIYPMSEIIIITLSLCMCKNWLRFPFLFFNILFLFLL